MGTKTHAKVFLTLRINQRRMWTDIASFFRGFSLLDIDNVCGFNLC